MNLYGVALQRIDISKCYRRFCTDAQVQNIGLKKYAVLKYTLKFNPYPANVENMVS